MENEVFTIRSDEWQAKVCGEVLPTIWNSRGAALAGMKTEMKRRGVHELSRDCWCNPTVETPNVERNRPERSEGPR
jgi:hypothetical protein